LDPKKGLDLLLSALARLQHEFPNISLVVAGAGSAPFEAWLREETRRLGVVDRVLMIGPVAENEKWSVLAGGDVFVLASREENFGIAVAEAMSMGLPVVVTPGVAISAEVAMAGAGLVATYDEVDLATKIGQLLSDEPGRSAMATMGRELVSREYSSEGTTAQLMRLYELLCRQGFPDR
jgi:glycosyltransferase involved in cell wall biosynthesis